MFNFNNQDKTKKKQGRSSREENSTEVITTPEHVDVTKQEDGELKFVKRPEKKTLVVKTQPIIPDREKAEEMKKTSQSESETDVPVIDDNINKKKKSSESKKKDNNSRKEKLEGKSLIKVPIAFDKWFNSISHDGVSVRKAYKLVDELEKENNEVYLWVDKNEDTFAEIWLGAEYKVSAIPIYETTIENKGKRPNILAKEGDGNIVMKPYALLDDDDITELTEEEICQDWAFLFENGHSRLLNAEDI